jgi:hypothetical protein
VALAAQYRTDAVLTLDRRDFRAMRPLTPHKWFRLLPGDRRACATRRGAGQRRRGTSVA